jgi:phosphoribosyl-AMP cyclohydrolase
MFAERRTVEQVEESAELAPKFDEHGLMPVVVSDAATGELLMHGHMNDQALQRTIETGEAHYYSRSRDKLWKKGESSGMVQRVKEMRVDDDQDAVWLRVEVQGQGSCHVGYRSCFYRAVPVGERAKSQQAGEHGGLRLRFLEDEKAFDPQDVYGNAPNPTRL